MKRFLVILVLLSVALLNSCGGGTEKKCDEGYTLIDGECVKDSNGNNDEYIPIDDEQPDNNTPDGDADDTTDEVEDADENPYTGNCIEIEKDGTLNIDIETKVLTIGTVKLKGTEKTDADYGELWAENKGTLSEFKVADVDGDLSGKSFDFPEGRYNFFFRGDSADNRLAIAQDIEIISDRTLDIELPIYHLTGAVKKNTAAIAVDAGQEATTMVKLKSGTYEYSIPYADFAAFDIVVAEGTYSVSYEGQLSAGGPAFKGSVTLADGNIEVTAETAKDINIETVTYSGNAVNKGYDVAAGQIAIVETPPFNDLSAVIVPDLATKAYSVEVIKNSGYDVIYLPETDSYPTKYIKLETWDDFSGNKSQDVELDFARLHGSVTFLGNAVLPSASNCDLGEGCSRGKLKVVGFDATSLLVKDFKATGDDFTYEVLLVRGTETEIPDPANPPDGTKLEYNPKTYRMVFESHLNNVSNGFTSIPFTMTLKHLNNDGLGVPNFTFQDTELNMLTEREINFNIAPLVVEGTVTLNGSAFTSDKDDFIILKDETGIETPVVNIKDLTDGKFSFMAPSGEYDVIYSGTGILNSEFRTYIDEGMDINSNMTDAEFDLRTAKILLDFDVNGTPFKEWIAGREDVDNTTIVINPDKTAATYLIDVTTPSEGAPYGEVLSGSKINAYLDIFLKNAETENKSFTRSVLLAAHQMTSDKTAEVPIDLTPFKTIITLNGTKIAGTTEYQAIMKISGSNKTELYYPSTGASINAMFKSGEHKSPLPEILLNDGFDTKQEIAIECIYLAE